MTPHLHAPLLAWFDAHARDLPWREPPGTPRDPYRVWVSEVLLQQTQVVRGREYYARFLTAFPTVRDLASAPQEAVLKAWEGCGYYARARNLHAAARIVARDGFPASYEAWRLLPGVGPYTAAAVTSIAYGEARAVADGNVRRVLARVHGEHAPTTTWVQARADEALYTPDPGRWNEAVMDLGATVCTPRNPRCTACPLAFTCAAFRTRRPEAYPAPKQRAAPQRVHAVAVLVGDAKHAYLETRAGTLLGGLAGLPVEVVTDGDTAAALARLAARLRVTPGALLGVVTHTMTHRHVTLHVHAATGALPLTPVHEKPLARLDQKALALHAPAQPTLLS